MKINKPHNNSNNNSSIWRPLVFLCLLLSLAFPMGSALAQNGSQKVFFAQTDTANDAVASYVFTSDEPLSVIWVGGSNSLGRFVFNREIEIDSKVMVPESDGFIASAGLNQSNREIAIVLSRPFSLSRREIDAFTTEFDFRPFVAQDTNDLIALDETDSADDVDQIIRDNAFINPDEDPDNLTDSADIFDNRLVQGSNFISSVRSSPHGNFDRIVVDFVGVPQYDLNPRAGNRLITITAPVRFNDINGINDLEALPSVESVRLEGDGKRIAITTRANIDLTSYRYRDSLVLELGGRGIEAYKAPAAAARPSTETQRPATRAPAASTSAPSTSKQTASKQKGGYETVNVEIGKHPDFVRLKFDWSRPINYLVSHKNGILDIVFFAPAEFVMPSLSGYNDAGIGKSGQVRSRESSKVSIPVDQRIPVRHFSSGNALVIDMVLSGNNPFSDTPLETGQAPGGRELQPPFEVSGRTGEAVTAPTVAALKALLAQEQAAIQPAFEAGGRTGGLNDSIFADDLSNGGGIEDGALASLHFNWAHPAGAAVFMRGNHVWIAFDAYTDLDLKSLRGQVAENVSDIRHFPAREATVLRLTTRKTLYPKVTQNGFAWIVTLHDRPQETAKSLAVKTLPHGRGLTLALPVGNPGKTLTIIDPVARDRILVGTLPSEGYGVSEARTYPGFQLLKSPQGVALVTLDRSINLELQNISYVVRRPDGLPITGDPIIADRPQQALLPFGRWHRPDVRPEHIISESLSPYISATLDPNVADNQPRFVSMRRAALADIAGYYLSAGLYPEALGADSYLDFMLKRSVVDPDLTETLLHGAAAVMQNDFTTAKRWLEDPSIRPFDETALWLGALAAKEMRWGDAVDLFAKGEAILSTYPNKLFVDLALLQLRALVEESLLTEADIAFAQFQSRDLLEHQARWLGFLKAKRDALTGHKTEALRAFMDLSQGGDRAAVFAKYAIYQTKLETGNSDPKDLAESLEKILLTVRGEDALEFDILHRLALDYLQLNQPQLAFGHYREALSYFPNNPKSLKLREELLLNFKRLFLEESDDTSATVLYNVYQNFQELTPSDESGDRLIEQLANKLFASGLFDGASELLETQVNFRLKGREKVRTALKLILLNMISTDPDIAKEMEFMQTLALRSLDINDPLRHDARLLEAYLISQQGGYDEGLRLLAGDVSETSDLLRRDIANQTQDWRALALVQERLTGSPPLDPDAKIDPSRLGSLISWAVALYRLEDTAGLEKLASIYGPFIPAGDVNTLFQLLTSNKGVGDTESLSKVIALIEELDSNAPSAGFLDKMLARYFNQSTNGSI